MVTKKKIAIIFHENDRNRTQAYAITHLADFWREEGVDVHYVFGPNRFVSADLAILHVDLSIVPDKYLAYAQRYPFTLNGSVRDIRKSTFSNNLLTPDDLYEGQVIVKSNLNCAGKPERYLHQSYISPLFRNLKKKLIHSRLMGRKKQLCFYSPSDYLILESPQLIPRDWFERSDIVVEKFLPEIDSGYYCVRNYFFLGDRSACILRKATHPIVNSSSTISVELVDVHPEIEKIRKERHFDYGKFDYVVHDNIPVLFDINKTTGAPASPNDSAYLAQRREFASGIYFYFPDHRCIGI